MELKQRAQAVNDTLLVAYGRPEWRNPLPPLDELVSTILSQNTNDTNRDRAFQALRQGLPTWEAVRDADEQAVIELIRPAGLGNQKGPRIQNVLREITRQRGELNLDFLRDMPDPEALAWLMAFKGVGPKTASIVLFILFGQAGFSCRYPYLPGQRATGSPSRKNDRGPGPRAPGPAVPAGKLLRGAS